MIEIPYAICQVCGTPRLDEGEELWVTIIRIVHISTNHVTMEICVCPECREKYSLSEIVSKRMRGEK